MKMGCNHSSDAVGHVEMKEDTSTVATNSSKVVPKVVAEVHVGIFTDP